MEWRTDGGFGASWLVLKPVGAYILRGPSRNEVCTYSVSVLARRYDIGGIYLVSYYRGASSGSGCTSCSRRNVGCKKEKFWPVLSGRYLCTAISHFGDTGNYSGVRVLERIWDERGTKWNLVVVIEAGGLPLVEY